MIRKIIQLVSGLLFIGLACVFVLNLFVPPPTADAAGVQTGARCDPAASGATGRQSFTSKRGLPIVVVTPTDYDGVHRYGLLVMFPPAGFNSKASEQFYQLTQPATAAGYLIAFSDAVPLSKAAINVQGDVVNEVASRWCIDVGRIVLAGHSDGGSLAQGVVLRQAVGEIKPSAIFSSAAGINSTDLQTESCPTTRRVSVVHSGRDERFPNFGRGAADWWARCFACKPLPAIPQGQVCVDTNSCAEGGAVRYCETNSTHAQLPPTFQEEIGRFLRETKQ